MLSQIISQLPLASQFAIRNFLDLELWKKASKLMRNRPHRNRNSDTGDFVSEMLKFTHDHYFLPPVKMKLPLTQGTS